MPPRTLTLALVILCALFAFGCQPDCRLMCEEAEEANCYGGSAPDCEKMCKHQEDLVMNAGCEADYDAYLVCLDGLDDICDAIAEPCLDTTRCGDPKCDDEAEDLFDCYMDYCEDHPRNNECESGF